MMEITREMKIQMFNMTLDGETLFEIAKKTGYSTEEVAKAICISLRDMYHHKGWVYPGLEAWMHENRVTLRAMADMCGVQYATMHRWITGKISMTKRNIDKILSVTGLTYEEAFGDPRKTD